MHKLLFIHPDQKLQSLYRQHLKNYFSVDSAYNGLQGLRQIKSNRPNIILSEYSLPDFAGSTLLSYVRNHDELYKTPFIFVSKRPLVFESLEFGANDWVNLLEHNP